MSVDLMTRTVILQNGVSLTWPSRLDIKELLYSYQVLGLNIDLLNKASTNIDYKRLIDGTILSIFNGDGSNQVQEG